jgi:hypothetical protein
MTKDTGKMKEDRARKVGTEKRKRKKGQGNT